MEVDSVAEQPVRGRLITFSPWYVSGGPLAMSSVSGLTALQPLMIGNKTDSRSCT